MFSKNIELYAISWTLRLHTHCTSTTMYEWYTAASISNQSFTDTFLKFARNWQGSALQVGSVSLREGISKDYLWCDSALSRKKGWFAACEAILRIPKTGDAARGRGSGAVTVKLVLRHALRSRRNMSKTGKRPSNVLQISIAYHGRCLKYTSL